MAVNPNFTNANATTIFPAIGGGGAGGGSNATFNSITLNSSTGSYPAGAITLVKQPGNTGSEIINQYWAGQSSFDLTPSILQAITGGFTDDWGAKGVKLSQGASVLTTVPYGYIQGSNDGVIISGQAANTGALTQTWFEAHNGATKVLCVSTMTDAAKTQTLDFNAFISTMASVYPDIVKPYSATG